MGVTDCVNIITKKRKPIRRIEKALVKYGIHRFVMIPAWTANSVYYSNRSNLLYMESLFIGWLSPALYWKRCNKSRPRFRPLRCNRVSLYDLMKPYRYKTINHDFTICLGTLLNKVKANNRITKRTTCYKIVCYIENQGMPMVKKSLHIKPIH